jgi:hypothetical protein
LMNYTYQSFNMRGKSKIRPYYDLVANVAAEEMGHIELVANTVNLLLDQTEASGDEAVPPLNFTGMTGNPDHFANFGLAYPAVRVARRGRAITPSTRATSSSTCSITSSSNRAPGWAFGAGFRVGWPRRSGVLRDGRNGKTSRAVSIVGDARWSAVSRT